MAHRQSHRPRGLYPRPLSDSDLPLGWWIGVQVGLREEAGGRAGVSQQGGEQMPGRPPARRPGQPGGQAAGSGGLASGLAWASGRWSARHLLAALLGDPGASARLLAEADLDPDPPPERYV